MKEEIFRVLGMSCQGCVRSVSRAIAALSGVEEVEVSLEEGVARVLYVPEQLSPDAIRAAIVEAGFEAG